MAMSLCTIKSGSELEPNHMDLTLKVMAVHLVVVSTEMGS
jgi:hypothetical protein